MIHTLYPLSYRSCTGEGSNLRPHAKESVSTAPVFIQCKYQIVTSVVEISARLVIFAVQNKYVGAQSYCAAKNISINL